MKLRSILAAAAALLAPCVASADGVAGQVTLGQLSYTLTDLAPNDGINPSITFLPLSASIGSPGSITLLYEAGGGWQQDLERGVGREDLNGKLSGSGITLRGSATGLSDPATWTLIAYAGSAASLERPTNIDAMVQSGQQAFVLSPHTGLSVTVTGHETWTADPDARPTNFSTDARITLTALDPLGQISSTASPDSWWFGRAPYDTTATATVSYDNTNAVSVNGSVDMSADVVIIQPPVSTPPVPEPTNIAMYAAGLPLLLALRRRASRPGAES